MKQPSTATAVVTYTFVTLYVCKDLRRQQLLTRQHLDNTDNWNKVSFQTGLVCYRRETN